LEKGGRNVVFGTDAIEATPAHDGDVAPNGYAIDRAMVRQKKTGRPVRFELTEHTRQAVDENLRSVDRKSGAFLFSGRPPGQSMTTRQ
jgi:hypothetical protein